MRFIILALCLLAAGRDTPQVSVEPIRLFVPSSVSDGTVDSGRPRYTRRRLPPLHPSERPPRPSNSPQLLHC